MNENIGKILSSALAGEHLTAGSKRGWAFYMPTRSPADRMSFLMGKADGTYLGEYTSTTGLTFAEGDVLKVTFEPNGANGLIRFFQNGTARGTAAVTGQNKVYCTGGNLLVMAYNSGIDGLSAIKISDIQIKVNGSLVFQAPLDGSTWDIVGGLTGAINGTVSLAERSDYSTFRNDEHGFAIKSGVLYPKLLDGTGYAGLVGDPDAVYQGLIATKGQPEIGTKQYLGTEYDFGDATAITDAGISWDEWNDTDDNLNTVGTAETDLDTDYYNAITASLMTCTSIAGYAGTSNVSKRLFFKVADGVMKDDGSFLAESGTVQEILVYKTDLTAGQIAKVRKYCKDTGV